MGRGKEERAGGVVETCLVTFFAHFAHLHIDTPPHNSERITALGLASATSESP